MIAVHDGQRGLYTHFGEDAADPELTQVRTSGNAPETLVEECEHPRLAPLHLKVTPAN